MKTEQEIRDEMIDEEKFAEDLRDVFEKHGVKEIKTDGGKLGFVDGEFRMYGINIILNKPSWYIKEKLKQIRNRRK